LLVGWAARGGQAARDAAQEATVGADALDIETVASCDRAAIDVLRKTRGL